MSTDMLNSIALPTKIDEVIAAYDALIAADIEERSRLGYFLALYRGVTIRVKEPAAKHSTRSNRCGRTWRRLEHIADPRLQQLFHREAIRTTTCRNSR
jgi:hypothetical protein